MAWLSENTLLLRLGLALGTISVLATAGMVSSERITHTLQGKAAAVNQAGTLRMQTYRIATRLALPGHGASSPTLYDLTEEFERRLRHPRLTAVLPEDPTQGLRGAYDRVVDTWHGSVRPLLVAYIEAPAGSGQAMPAGTAARRTALSEDYLARVGDFVAEIDRLVSALEVDAESRIEHLRRVQFLALSLILVVVILTMYMGLTRLRRPLKTLLACTDSARRGDFSMRARVTGRDELARLAEAFNQMSADLGKTYEELEARVRVKTADLEQSNLSLELLYFTVNQLNATPVPNVSYATLLRRVQTVLGTGPGTICLFGQDRSEVTRLASTWPAGAGAVNLCSPPRCEACIGEGDTHLFDVNAEPRGAMRLISVAIRDQARHYGVMHLEVPARGRLEGWQRRLLETVAGHIGIAITSSRRASEGRRLALLEERGVIARELHDSLAQSLSYLKIQVSRLEARLARGRPDAETVAVVRELREGLSSAYRQLRELLATFRLKMDGTDFAGALTDTVREFQRRGALEIRLDNRLGAQPLSANEEVHVLHILREALSNVLRHAQASRVEVRLEHKRDQHLAVTVTDDGVGIPARGPEREHHYGIAIMRERARSLGGEVDIAAPPEGGTRVRLVFVPHSQLAAAASA